MDIKNLNKKLIIRFGIVMGIILMVFIGIIIVKLITGGRIEYTKIEEKMINGAKNYYANHKDELPQYDNGYVTISIEKLVETNNLKPLEKLVKDENASCNGEVVVTKINDNYLYSTNLDCGEYYKTKKLKDVIISNVVTSGNGLYNFNNNYIFRGDNVNNYLKFANKTWRILKVSDDGSIRLIETTKRNNIVWDDRYNSEKEYNFGINDFTVSRVRDSLEDIYSEFSNDEKVYILKQNLCIGKRNDNDTNNSGIIECSKIFENQNLGLIQVNEYALASLDDSCISPTDPECTNYNYLTSFPSFWTLTADNSTTHKVFKIAGSPFTTNASNTAQIKAVININSNVNYISGDGSETNPYMFK